MRELSRKPAQLVERLDAGEGPIVLTRNGAPFAAVIPLDERRFVELALSTSPQLIATVEDANEAVVQGRTRSLDEAVEEVASESDAASRELAQSIVEEAAEASAGAARPAVAGAGWVPSDERTAPI